MARSQRDAQYVLDRVDLVLGSAGAREYRFEWLLGDPGKSGRRASLPVDAYWPELALVVEVYERQHDHPTAHFDKPERLTVSGVHRGEQRRIYDQRRRDVIPAHGLTLLVVRTTQLASTPRGRLLRQPGRDDAILTELIRGALAAPGMLHEVAPRSEE